MFSKTPGISPVKTRLAKDIGEELACEIFSRSIDVTLEQIQKWNMDYVVAVADSLDNGFWDKHNTIMQTVGDLGAKLAHVYETLREDYDRVYFIGADSFHLDFASIEKEILKFEEGLSEYLIGNTLDGGFYIFGAKEGISKDIWLGVEYSKSTTAEELVECVGKPFTLLPTEFDLDVLDDLKELKKLDSSPLDQSQVDLIQFILDKI